MNGYILAADLAAVYGITLNHVYVLAHKGKWRRVRDLDGNIRYNIDDVAASLAGVDPADEQP